MSYFEEGSLVLFVLNLIVLFLTLLAVRRYTRETRRLALASVEQMPRPCMTVVQQADNSDEAILASRNFSIAGPTLRFKNDGTAHAVNLRHQIGIGSFTPPRSATGELGIIPPGEVFDSNCSLNALSNPATLVIEYESLGGAKYRTSAIIEERRWVCDFKFEKLSSV
jgi:hypothetical protein